MGVQVPLSEPHNKGVISYNASLFREAFLVCAQHGRTLTGVSPVTSWSQRVK